MRSGAAPMMVSGMGTASQACVALEGLPLQRGRGAIYDEAWLQRLIQAHPSLLPIDAIEPALAGPVPICMELALPSGYVDNLMITRSGGLVVVETKLWRNPEARREVVGQILDYAKDLARLNYEDLEKAAQAARRDKTSLCVLVHGDALPHEEAAFIDAVSRNLRLGRMLLIIAGDGIQESAEQLTDFLQRHLGLHFTLAMVEMSLWSDPVDGRVLVQPRVLAKTVQIERAVIRLESGVALSVSQVEPATATASRPATLTSEAFFEALARSDGSLPARVKTLLNALEPLGVYPDIRRSLMLKWRGPNGMEFTLGAIVTDGRLMGEYINWPADTIGRVDLAHAYQEAIANLIPGGKLKRTPVPTSWRVVDATGANPEIGALLGRSDEWLVAIADYLGTLEAAIEARE